MSAPGARWGRVRGVALCFRPLERGTVWGARRCTRGCSGLWPEQLCLWSRRGPPCSGHPSSHHSLPGGDPRSAFHPAIQSHFLPTLGGGVGVRPGIHFPHWLGARQPLAAWKRSPVLSSPQLSFSSSTSLSFPSHSPGGSQFGSRDAPLLLRHPHRPPSPGSGSLIFSAVYCLRQSPAPAGEAGCVNPEISWCRLIWRCLPTIRLGS